MSNIKRTKVPVLTDCSFAKFKSEIALARQPVVLRGLDLGPCTRLWTPDYLIKTFEDKSVRVHVGQQRDLDFRNKNFNYCDMKIKELVRRAAKTKNDEFFVDENEIYYLRN